MFNQPLGRRTSTGRYTSRVRTRSSQAKRKNPVHPAILRRQRQRTIMFFLGMLSFFVMFLGFSAFQYIPTDNLNPQTLTQRFFKSNSSESATTELERELRASLTPGSLALWGFPLALLNMPAEIAHLNYAYNQDIPATQKLLPILPTATDLKLQTDLEALFATYPSQFTPHLYVYDPADGTEVNINGYEDVAAASVIKLPVLLNFFQDVDAGHISLDSPLLFQEYLRASGAGELQYKDSGVTLPAVDVATNMIQISDNTCTNMMISALGGIDSVNHRLQGLGIRQTMIRNWLPDLEGTNKISMYEMVTMLYNLDRGFLLSSQSRLKALEILRGTHNRRLLVSALPPGTVVAHKTGDIGSALADAGIVSMPWTTKEYSQYGDYIVAIQVDRPYNNYTARDMIQRASAIIYNHIATKRGQLGTATPDI